MPCPAAAAPTHVRLQKVTVPERAPVLAAYLAAGHRRSGIDSAREAALANFGTEQPTLEQLEQRFGPGRPRTRPDALIANKVYSARAIRAELRTLGVEAVIPHPSDEIAHRRWRRSASGRPPQFDALAYEGRNVIERSFKDHKQWRGLATTRYDKLAAAYRGTSSQARSTIRLRE